MTTLIFEFRGPEDFVGEVYDGTVPSVPHSGVGGGVLGVLHHPGPAVLGTTIGGSENFMCCIYE